MFRFADPAALFITPDHYVYRMLHSQGVPLEALGIMPQRDGTPIAPAPAPRDAWRLLAQHMHLFRGTPVRDVAGRVARGTGKEREGVHPLAHGVSDNRLRDVCPSFLCCVVPIRRACGSARRWR
jgi:hypothetical protein